MQTVLSGRVRPYPHFKFPEEVIIEAELLTTNECGWYGVPVGSYALRCTNYGWFPSEVLCGVVRGVFCDTFNLGVSFSGNLGTASIAVLDVKEACRLLRGAGYNVVL